VSISIGSASSASLGKFGFMGGILLGGLHLIDRFLMVDGLGRQARGLGLGGDIAGTVGGAPGPFSAQGPAIVERRRAQTDEGQQRGADQARPPARGWRGGRSFRHRHVIGQGIGQRS
jgi:hypothetical protein